MKNKKLLNVVIFVEIAILLSMVAYFWSWKNQYSNEQRDLILKYINENKIVGLSLDECENLFGEPYWIKDNEAYFDGGYYLQFSIGIRYCKYRLVLSLDEEQKVDYVSYEYILDLT